MFLSDIKTGERALVTSLCATGKIRRRLLDIGLIDGTEVECVGVSPLGDPKAFLIRGAIIALRKEDSGRISVKCYGP